MSYKIWYMGTW